MAFGAYDAFVESWSIYVVTDPNNNLNPSLASRWTSPNIGSGGGEILPTGGRVGNYALHIGAFSGVNKTMAHNSHWIAGCGFKTQTLSSGGGGIFSLFNNTQQLFGLRLNADGTLSMVGANNSQVIFTTPSPIVFNLAWIYWEVDVTITGTTNLNVAAELRVNGVVQGSGNVNTGVNKANLLSNSATANVFGVGPGLASAGFSTIDGSFYIHNGTGDVPGYWGDIKILRVVPNGDTAQADWTPKTGVVHYDQVHEIPKDDDTTYVATGVAGNKDSWDWENLSPLTGVIRTVQLSAAARKDDEGSKSFRTGVGATLSEAQSDTFNINDSYVYYHFNWDVDPATGLPWTIPNFNAKQFGIELMS